MKKKTAKPLIEEINAGRRKTSKSDTGLEFRITEEDVQKAKCRDGSECVIAQALTHTLGKLFEYCYIGSNTSKIVTKTEVIAYGTPSNLAKALRIFDKTGQWDLPPGIYGLNPHPDSKRPHRLDVLKTMAEAKRKAGIKNGKKVVFTPMMKVRACPTRIVPRIETLRAK